VKHINYGNGKPKCITADLSTYKTNCDELAELQHLPHEALVLVL